MFAELGYPKHSFGLRRVRAEGAPTGANVGVKNQALNVTADGRLIEPRTATFKDNWNLYSQCQEVSFFFFSFFIFESGHQ